MFDVKIIFFFSGVLWGSYLEEIFFDPIEINETLKEQNRSLPKPNSSDIID